MSNFGFNSAYLNHSWRCSDITSSLNCSGYQTMPWHGRGGDWAFVGEPRKAHRRAVGTREAVLPSLISFDVGRQRGGIGAAECVGTFPALQTFRSADDFWEDEP